MRLLYFGDRHNRVTTPESRTDNYQDSMFLKDEEIRNYAKKYGVKAFLQPGDFWETPNPPLDYSSRIIQEWFNTDIRDESSFERQPFIPMIGVAGNHELYGNNINTLPKTMLGFMEKMGFMKFATKENPVIMKTEDGLTVAITGTHYHLDIDSEDFISDYVVDEKLADFHIHIVHGLLSDKSMGKLIRHTLIDQIKHTKADLTLCGHDHIGFPITEVDGKFFANTGAIPRLSNDVKEMKRKPKILLIDINKKDGIKLEEIYLNVKDGQSVLSRDKIMKKKAKEDKIKAFKDAVRASGEIVSTNINEIIRDMGQDIAPEIREDVINQVSIKMEEMDASASGASTDAYIEKVILENFMSHEYTELDVSRGFNIFVGESRQGKSAMLRAIDWVYQNKISGKARSFVRKGADYAKVTLNLSNGYVVSRYIETKKSGKNGYFITSPDSGDTLFHNTKILPEIQKILGFNLFNLDKDLQFNLNYLKQGTGWFLIGDQYSAPLKAKIIGGIYGTQYADAVTRDLETEEKRMNDRIKHSSEEIEKIEENIKGFDYLETLSESIKMSEEIFSQIEKLELRKSKITELSERRDLISEEIKNCEAIISEIGDITNVTSLFRQTQINTDKSGKLKELVEKRDSYVKYCRYADYLISELSGVSAWVDALKAVNTFLDRQQNLSVILSKRESLYNQTTELNGIISATEEVLKARKLYDTTSRSFEQKRELGKKLDHATKLEKELSDAKRWNHQCDEIINEHTSMNEDSRKILEITSNLINISGKIQKVSTERGKYETFVAEADKSIEKHSQDIKVNVVTYQNLLTEVGQCPVCLSKVKASTIKQIAEKYHV